VNTGTACEESLTEVSPLLSKVFWHVNYEYWLLGRMNSRNYTPSIRLHHAIERPMPSDQPLRIPRSTCSSPIHLCGSIVYLLLTYVEWLSGRSSLIFFGGATA